MCDVYKDYYELHKRLKETEEENKKLTVCLEQEVEQREYFETKYYNIKVAFYTLRDKHKKAAKEVAKWKHRAENHECSCNDNTLLKEIEHELTTLNGLYMADNTEFKDSWRYDATDLMYKVGDYIRMNDYLEESE